MAACAEALLQRSLLRRRPARLAGRDNLDPVNLNTLDDLDPRDVKVIYWDGRHNNWHAGSRDAAWPIFATM